MKRSLRSISNAKDVNSPLISNWISEQVVITHFQISRRTLYDWHEKEGLPKYIIGRLVLYKETEVYEWIEKHRKVTGHKRPAKK